jgi:hypothetical protein
MENQESKSKQESVEQPSGEGLSSSVLFAGMYLRDRADGVRGHFCIGRHMEKYRNYPTPTWEYWTGEKWASFGKVYNREEAIAVRESLANVEAWHPLPGAPLRFSLRFVTTLRIRLGAGSGLSSAVLFADLIERCFTLKSEAKVNSRLGLELLESLLPDRSCDNSSWRIRGPEKAETMVGNLRCNTDDRIMALTCKRVMGELVQENQAGLVLAKYKSVEPTDRTTSPA